MILYNPIKNTLSNSNKTVKIGYRESQILTLLLEHSPAVVEKRDIVQFAWGTNTLVKLRWRRASVYSGRPLPKWE